MSGWGNFILDKGFDAATALTKYRAVKLVETNGSEAVTPVTADTDIAVGVAQFGVTADEILQGKGCSARLAGVTYMETGGAVTRGKEVVLDSSGRAVQAAAATNATLLTGTVGANNAITWTANEAGTDGNGINIVLVDPAGASASLAVDVDGKTITVSLATNSGSALTSTAAQVIAAVLEHDTASQLVTPSNTTGSSGAGVVAAAASAATAGGANKGSGKRIVGQAMDGVSGSGKQIPVLWYMGARVL